MRSEWERRRIAAFAKRSKVVNVGGDLLAWLTRTVSLWGNIASIGLAGGSELHTTVMPFILRGVSLLGISSANCPMPLRASASTAHEPTPPMPTTQTCARARRATLPRP